MQIQRAVHKNLILTIVALAQFMVVLDTSIVNVALPAIYHGLHFGSASSLQWVVTAYTLAFGGFLLLGGRAADLYGRKRMFILAMTLFSLTSLLCGLAQNSTMLEVTRALQGLAAAFMSPAALSIVLTTFKEGKNRNKALSVWGAVAAGGAAAGVLLGGILTEYIDWRWNFFVNIPVGILVIIAAMRYVPETKADLEHRQLDLPGAALVTSGLMLLVFTLTKAPSYGWLTGRTLGLLAASFILLAAFVMNELRVKHPLMPLSILKIRNLAGANLTQLPIMASLFSLFFFLTLYLQNVLGYSPIRTGLSFLPVTIVIGMTSAIMSHIVNKIGYRKPLLVAPILLGIGLYYLSHVRVGGTYWHDVFPGLTIMAFGLGIVFVSITIAATSGVPQRLSGLASGLLNTSQQIGGALGLAILSGVAASTTSNYIAHHAQDATVSSTLLVQAQVQGFHHAFYVGVGFALTAFVLSLVIIRQTKGADLTAEPVVIAH